MGFGEVELIFTRMRGELKDIYVSFFNITAAIQMVKNCPIGGSVAFCKKVESIEFKMGNVLCPAQREGEVKFTFSGQKGGKKWTYDKAMAIVENFGQIAEAQGSEVGIDLVLSIFYLDIRNAISAVDSANSEETKLIFSHYQQRDGVAVQFAISDRFEVVKPENVINICNEWPSIITDVQSVQCCQPPVPPVSGGDSVSEVRPVSSENPKAQEIPSGCGRPFSPPAPLLEIEAMLNEQSIKVGLRIDLERMATGSDPRKTLMVRNVPNRVYFLPNTLVWKLDANFE
ncbi:hypothetical protein ABW19_dt0202931 [Dactylella cylindrospora]|nr:hypothetical protein ABW19_dt0202931 [Dactylella cylindrospora]